MKSFGLAGVALASLSIGCAKGFSWDDLEDSDLYIRELDTFGIDARDLMSDYEPELLERDYMDEWEEGLYTRDVRPESKRILDNIASTKKEMFAVYKDMSKIVQEQKKKYPLTKETGKASAEYFKAAAEAKRQKDSGKKTAKKTESKSKSSKKKDADYDDVEEDFEEEPSKKEAKKKTTPKRKSSKKRDADFEDVTPDVLHNRATLDLVADAKPNSIIRCDLLFTSFKPSSELVQTLNYAEQHLKWDQWQYMEWDLLTLQAAQMKNLVDTCSAAQIDGLNARLIKVWTPFSKVVADLAGFAKKSNLGVDEKILQLAEHTVGSIAS